MRHAKSAVLLCVFLFTGNLSARSFEMDILESEDLFLLYFDPAQTHLVPHVLRTSHNSLAFQKYIFDWTPYERPFILLKDLSDHGNAGAGAAPRNGLALDVAPMSTSFETILGSDRIFATMNHELVHVANLDAANSQDWKWRRIFGGKPRQTSAHPETILYNYLTTPRMNVPRWYTEGAAVFMETWMSGGVGRAQGAYDEMVFRAMVRDDAHFYSNLGIVSEGVSVDFQTGVNAYLYGTRFISYMALHYSPEQVVEWLSRSEDSERYYSKQFRHVFGIDLETAWDAWIDFEHEFQAANLAAVREQPLTPTEPLIGQPLGSISRSFVDTETQTMLGAFRYPGVVAHVGRLKLDSAEVERLTDIKGPMKYLVTSTAWDPGSRTFFFTADNIVFRDLMALDVDTGKKRMLLRDARIGDLVFNPTDDSIWGLRHLNGYVALVRIPAPYEEWEVIHTFPYGRVPYELDISPDGSLMSASMGEINGDQYLRIFRIEDLLNGTIEPVSQFDFGTAIPEGFVFSPDGKYLFGSTFYTGVSNIVRYEVANGDIQWVSNAETGFFRPVPLEDGRLIVFEFTGQGFLPTLIDPVPLEDVSAITFLGSEIVRKHPVVKEWNVVNTLNEIDPDAVVTRHGKYRPQRELQYGSGYPVVEGYKDSPALGYHLRFQDMAQFHTLDVMASYSWDNDLPSSEKLHARIDYHTLDWTFSYWHNDADFYDLFGPTKRSRKGDAFLIGYDRTLIYDSPRMLSLSVDLNYYKGLDTLPDNQNQSVFLFQDILTAKAGLEYSHTRKSLGAVDHEKGWRWNVNAQVDNARGELIPKVRGGLDFGFALPWKHSSVWLYSAMGTADGKRLIPLTNTYFGGFGNNWVDDGEVKRYREYYSLPGWEIGEISAKKWAKTTLEWNLPPLRFREVGTPSLFLKHARTALFATALRTDYNKFYERTVGSVGFQVDFEFTLVHRLPMTFSVGYAAGFEDGDKRDDEWMLSLKIL
jgi:hypothetical protein